MAGPAIVAYGTDETRVEAVIENLYRYILERESEFIRDLWNEKDAVHYAITASPTQDQPINLADVQDNAGGGTDSDTNWIFAELVRQHALDAVVGVVCDPEVAAAAHLAGVGADITVGIGGKSGLPGHSAYSKPHSDISDA